MTAKQRKLLRYRLCAAKLGKGPRAMDRMAAKNIPGFPDIIFLGGARYMVEDQLDAFIQQIIDNKGLDGEPKRGRKPEVKGARGDQKSALRSRIDNRAMRLAEAEEAPQRKHAAAR